MVQGNPSDPASAAVRERFRELHRGLLHLHKTLLDSQRESYEETHGLVSAGVMLQLVLNDEQFDWLRTISKLIISIDELMDANDDATNGDAESLLAHTRDLLNPDASGTVFQKKYSDALRREPAAMRKHRELTALLSENS